MSMYIFVNIYTHMYLCTEIYKFLSIFRYTDWNVIDAQENQHIFSQYGVSMYLPFYICIGGVKNRTLCGSQ